MDKQVKLMHLCVCVPVLSLVSKLATVPSEALGWVTPQQNNDISVLLCVNVPIY